MGRILIFEHSALLVAVTHSAKAWINKPDAGCTGLAGNEMALFEDPPRGERGGLEGEVDR